MADLSAVLAKLKKNPLQELKLWPQDPSADIDAMLNGVLDSFFADLSLNTLDRDETDLCKQIFANAVITNLVDRQAQSDLEQIFAASVKSFSGRSIDTVYGAQELKKNHMPEPGPRVIYVAADVSDAARQYDASPDPRTRSALLAVLGAFYGTFSALFVLCDSDAELDTFKNAVNPLLQAAGRNPLPQDFSLKTRLFDGVMLRANYSLSNASCEPDSEARILMSWLTQNWQDRILPARTVESILPSTLVFFNARRLSRATTAELLTVRSDLAAMDMLDRSRILSFSQMSSLSTVTKAVKKMQLMQNQLNQVLKKSDLSAPTGRFAIKTIDMKRVQKKIIGIEKKMKNLDVSRNPTYHQFDTFQRPNRREPLNADLPGVSMDMGYYPDIHLYVDTSGSITQKDYEDSVSMIIDIAKRLNCDIYFNSFTTDISQETVIRCRDRSKGQIQRDIEKIPKLTGGTTIDQVWGYINATKKNRRQLSLLISDFYVDVPRYLKHPEHLWYLPTKDTSVSFAQKFAEKLPNPWRVLF